MNEPQDRCSRCNHPIRGWEDDWPNYGQIRFGSSSQAFAKLNGVNICADDIDFELWHEGHPLLTLNEAQRATLEWGPRSPAKFLLCHRCQTQFIKIVGEFFGFRQRYYERAGQKEGRQ